MCDLVHCRVIKILVAPKVDAKLELLVNKPHPEAIIFYTKVRLKETARCDLIHTEDSYEFDHT